MARLEQLIPDPEVLLALAPEELAPRLLEVIKSQLQNGMINRDNLGYGMFRGEPAATNNQNAYPREKRPQIELAITEAFSWLEANRLLIPAAGLNGNNGWRILSRQAQEIDGAQLTNLAAANSFPKILLHPTLRDQVWNNLIRGEYDTAVFVAFKSVEVRVREAGGYTAADIGVDLMRKAFDADKGPLRKTSDPVSERQALAHLFAGAIGSYKNPHSHRTVTIQDSLEAQEMVMLASHLLRIVDSRDPNMASA
ncbi:MAG TPA: TIGR02391 family protein [Rhizomicrobium sp.]|nr:TIGR02391 family protein [Rhizomicrobium sp.]